LDVVGQDVPCQTKLGEHRRETIHTGRTYGVAYRNKVIKTKRRENFQGGGASTQQDQQFLSGRLEKKVITCVAPSSDK